MNIVKGNLFDSSDNLAHCVARDFGMGKGIAKEFKSRFGRVEELKSQKVDIGQSAVLSQDGRFLYYLVTKEKSVGFPTYGSLKSSLIHVKKHMDDHNVSTLSIPRIGCGLDKLDWEIVSRMIVEILVGKTVTVYEL